MSLAPRSDAPSGPASDAATARRMSRQRRRDTVPELELRRALRALGLGYRVDVPLPGLPRRRCDVMFKGARVAVFVDGCFWHGCPVHATSPRNNGSWWVEKLRKNAERDRDTDQSLRALGWTVVRAWEHEDMGEVARTVSELVWSARKAPSREGKAGPTHIR